MLLHISTDGRYAKAEYLKESNKNNCICKNPPFIFQFTYQSNFDLAFNDMKEKSSYCLVAFPNTYRSLVVTFCLVDSRVCSVC